MTPVQLAGKILFIYFFFIAIDSFSATAPPHRQGNYAFHAARGTGNAFNKTLDDVIRGERVSTIVWALGVILEVRG